MLNKLDILCLKVGEPNSLGDVAEWLQSTGYVLRQKAVATGSFCIFGGTLIIVLPQKITVRVSTVGNKVEGLWQLKDGEWEQIDSLFLPILNFRNITRGNVIYYYDQKKGTVLLRGHGLRGHLPLSRMMPFGFRWSKPDAAYKTILQKPQLDAIIMALSSLGCRVISGIRRKNDGTREKHVL